MSEPEGEGPAAAAEAVAATGGGVRVAGGGGGGEGAGRVLHARSFKLRFAAQREPGRSDVSAVKPLGLPATVTDKFYRRAEAAGDGAAAERTQRALARIQDMFRRGPRDKYPAPYTSSHEYGWWWEEASRMASTKFSDRRLHHHIQDSAWLKARLLVLAADEKLKHK